MGDATKKLVITHVYATLVTLPMTAASCYRIAPIIAVVMVHVVEQLATTRVFAIMVMLLLIAAIVCPCYEQNYILTGF